MFISYIEARSEGNKKLEDFLFSRFRPEAKTAIDAWLKTDPLNNPNAPPHPFRMAEYVQAEQQEARLQEERAGQLLAAANEAKQTSDTYVLLTVLFASVLFFGGISGTFESAGLAHRVKLPGTGVVRRHRDRRGDDADVATNEFASGGSETGGSWQKNRRSAPGTPDPYTPPKARD